MQQYDMLLLRILHIEEYPMKISDYTIKPLGDHAITIQFEPVISEVINENVMQLREAIEKSIEAEHIKEILTTVPSYAALMVQYNPLILSYDALVSHVASACEQIVDEKKHTVTVTHIPVCYGGDYGPDLLAVAALHHMSTDEVVKRHTKETYRIYMLGFTPGFPYLGGLDEAIKTPRLATPRTKIPAGSVGIAGGQTGIYPVASPGGWQIIGQTPVKLFDPDVKEAFLLKAGHYLVFEAIDAEQFESIKANVHYRCRTSIYQGKAVSHGTI